MPEHRDCLHKRDLQSRLADMRRAPELYSEAELACVEKEFADLRERVSLERPG